MPRDDRRKCCSSLLKTCITGAATLGAMLALSSISIIGLGFAVWELLESHFFRDVDYLTLHYLHVSRGVVSWLLPAFWAAWFVLRALRSSERQLRRSRARYRGIPNSAVVVGIEIPG